LEHAAGLLLESCCVDAVLVPHVLVLLRSLFKSLVASEDRTDEGLFSSVDTNVVLEGGDRLADAATPLADVLATSSGGWCESLETCRHKGSW
jgi:hypothetical protein